MMDAPRCVQVAVLAPLRHLLDYLPPEGRTPESLVGCRVRVPLGRRRGSSVGLVVGVADSTWPAAQLKSVTEVLDAETLVPASLIGLAQWAAEYYCHPPGEALAAVFPLELRRGEAPRDAREDAWTPTARGLARLGDGGRLGPRQRELLGLAADAPLASTRVKALPFAARKILQGMVEQGLFSFGQQAVTASVEVPPSEPFLALNEAQLAAVTAVLDSAGQFAAWLLEGVTGSGKTEVYLHLARELRARGRQVLVLIPEIGLSEQLVRRFERRFGASVALLHSDLTDRERALIWERCRRGDTGILIGTRSALWTPLPALGLVIVDEEHDPSFKQQEGFRYSARDVAVKRAHQGGLPVVLGSATPSLESAANAARGKYRHLHLPERAGGARPPTLHGLDIRSLPLLGGLSDALCREMDAVLARGEQVMLFLNRRGYAPLVMCHGCGWVATCERCDARLVLHREAARLVCHHCDATRSLERHPLECCPAPAPMTLGVGTEQVESSLRERFPDHRILRMDRDSMRRKGQFEAACAAVMAGEVDILLGTQMLAKGHDFPAVTLVGIVDADSRLFATDFRAAERFAQLVVQVAGRAGRREQRGRVLIQTHLPAHPVMQVVLNNEYADFVKLALAERAAAQLPPFAAMAVMRAEAGDQALPTAFLSSLRRTLKSQAPAEVQVAGPVPASMERRAGKYRSLLMLSATRRGALADALRHLMVAIEASPLRNRVRWHVDVDPEEVG